MPSYIAVFRKAVETEFVFRALFPAFVKEGGIGIGREGDADRCIAIDENGNVVNGDLILYAKFTANTYTVTYNGNGGTPSVASKTVTYASTYGTLATASRTGYTLNGWYTAASGGTQVTADTVVKITSNQTLYAQWKANTFLTFGFLGN